MRCARFGRRCGGYESDRPVEEPRPAASPIERTLVPRFVTAGPSTPLFENEQEFSYFRHYCDDAVVSFAGAFELPVWSRVILQASHDQAFIRHAVIAISSLSKSASLELTNGSQCSSPGESSCSDSPKVDENFVLQHYNKFLQGSRKALSSGKHGRRMALIVCLIIICVEGLQWHHRSALKHLISGIDLLDEWLSSQAKTPTLPGISSPNPDVVEDEIIQQFRMLELESSVLVDPKPQEYHERLRKDGNDTVNEMPEKFTTTQEARQFLELIMRRSHHFLGTVVPQKPSPSTQQNDPETQSLVASFSTFETFEGSIQPLQFEQERYTAENRRWNAAFESLYASRAPDHGDYLSTQLLKIRSRVLGILLAGELSTTEMIYDQFLDDFAEILRLAKLFFQHPCSSLLIPEGSYSSNAGLIFPLRLIADKSRHHALRREAIALLKSRSWRESTFWSTSTAQISEWLMDVEEEGMEREAIPERARARLLEVELDEGKEVRRVRVMCVKGTGEMQEFRRRSWTWDWGGGGRSESGTPRSMVSGGSESTF